MKTLKMFHAVLVLLVLSIMVGCSDQITSLEEQSMNSSGKAGSINVDDQFARSVFHEQIKLKPNRQYELNQSNTGLKGFSEVSVQLIYPKIENDYDGDPCNGIEVYTSISDDTNLTCQSKNLNLNSIYLLNTNSEMVIVDVVLNEISSEASKVEDN